MDTVYSACTEHTPAVTPVEDAHQVELQQTLSYWHKGKQPRVEEKQKQQASAHSETVQHGAVLRGRREKRRRHAG